jgi:hypothetical protein
MTASKFYKFGGIHMKKATITITFDADKLGAIRQYMGKKDSELQTELDDVMQKLYEKYVPSPVREYIEFRDEAQDSEPEDKPKRPSRSAAAHDGGVASDQQ